MFDMLLVACFILKVKVPSSFYFYQRLEVAPLIKIEQRV